MNSELRIKRRAIQTRPRTPIRQIRQLNRKIFDHPSKHLFTPDQLLTKENDTTLLNIMRAAELPFGVRLSEIVKIKSSVGAAVRTMIARDYPKEQIAVMVRTKGDQWLDSLEEVGKYDAANYGERAEVMKKIDKCIDQINLEIYDESRSWELLVDFAAAAFGLTKDFPKLKKSTLKYLLENFPIKEMRKFKADYFGVTEKLRKNARTGQFFTPAGVSNMIAKISNLGDLKSGQSILEPTAGTGGMILAALDDVKPGVVIYAVELDHRLYKALMVNMMIYCPRANPFFVANANTLSAGIDWSKANDYDIKSLANVSADWSKNNKSFDNKDIVPALERTQHLTKQRVPHFRFEIVNGKIKITPHLNEDPKYYEPQGILNLMVKLGEEDKK